MEKRDYLQEQVITYIGNKRLLLNRIENEINKIQIDLGCDKTINVDLFSGSGIVARMLKKYSSRLIVNDLEKYSCIVNSCYLSNREDFDEKKYDDLLLEFQRRVDNNELIEGIITKNYAPKDDSNIQENERVFYTNYNAQIIDSMRMFVDEMDIDMQKYFLAPLLYKASVHVNTAGIFKGFYKDSETNKGKFGGNSENALSRIKAEIAIEKPVFSNYSCEVEISNQDALKAAQKFKGLDIVYLDPPYNQHPYGSNYFMLNVIIDNKITSNISKVSGIPKNWNRSNYNKKNKIYDELKQLIETIDSKYILLSYNSEGFLTFDDIMLILNESGDVTFEKIEYNAYRGSRNLNNRDLYVEEYLFVLKKLNFNE